MICKSNVIINNKNTENFGNWVFPEIHAKPSILFTFLEIRIY